MGWKNFPIWDGGPPPSHVENHWSKETFFGFLSSKVTKEYSFQYIYDVENSETLCIIQNIIICGMKETNVKNNGMQTESVWQLLLLSNNISSKKQSVASQKCNKFSFSINWLLAFLDCRLFWCSLVRKMISREQKINWARTFQGSEFTKFLKQIRKIFRNFFKP